MKQAYHSYVHRFLKHRYSDKIVHEFIRFAIVGTIATVLHYGIYYILLKWINVNIAYTIGYISSFVANFYLTSFFTFNVKPSWVKLVGMISSHFINYLMHMALLNLFLWIGLSKTIAPLPVFAIVIPINFLIIRFVFKYKKIKSGQGEKDIHYNTGV
ncbi:MAG: GtrA family protein [Bacteroidales bacterium]|nr:GtrA family protein [Bacteroidales bacterium]